MRRAKEEQGNALPPPVPQRDAPKPLHALPEMRPVPTPGDRTFDAEDTPIVYTHTRTVKVANDTLRSRRVVVPGESGPAMDAYRVLSTQVLQSLRANDWNAVAIVSAGFREGKTLTAVNLAICLSMEVGHTVLLVDADLRRPGVHEYFSVDGTPGLSEHLLMGAPLDDMLFHPGIAGLVVLPAGRPLSTSAEMLGSPRMAALVQDLKRRYPARIVLFDLPPVLSAADALAFAPHVDAAIMVVQERRTAPEEVHRAAELLDRTNLIGTVLNNSTHAGVRDGSPVDTDRSPRAERTSRRRRLKLTEDAQGWLGPLRRIFHRGV